MTDQKIIETTWDPVQRLVVTRLSGTVDKTDIERWERSLQQALEQIPDHGLFKIFVNIHGFKAVDLDAHKRFRAIVPMTLAQYGWKVGYVDLFEEEAKSMVYSNTRGVQCAGAAHCHHDDTKIELYATKYSRANEHFFTDPEQARLWIEQLAVRMDSDT